MKTITVTLNAKKFEDEDNCLKAAEVHVAGKLGIRADQCQASWAGGVDDRQREEILVTYAAVHGSLSKR